MTSVLKTLLSRNAHSAIIFFPIQLKAICHLVLRREKKPRVFAEYLLDGNKKKKKKVKMIHFDLCFSKCFQNI